MARCTLARLLKSMGIERIMLAKPLIDGFGQEATLACSSSDEG